VTLEPVYRRPRSADHSAILALFAEQGWKTDAKMLAALLAPANAIPLCACQGERVVGFFLATRWGNTAWTGYLIVTEALRGRGIGHALKQRLIADLQAAGVTTFRNISAPRLHRFQTRQRYEVERRIVLLTRPASRISQSWWTTTTAVSGPTAANACAPTWLTAIRVPHASTTPA